MNAQDKYVKYDLVVALGVLLGKKHPEAVVQRCSVRKVFLEISQKTQESTCARASFLIKLHFQSCYFQVKRDAPVFQEKCLVFQKTCFKVKVMKNIQGLSSKNVTKIF